MAKLNFGKLDYLPNRRDIGIGDVKAEYRRLKSIAQKRLKNIKNSEFANSKTYQYYNQLFGKGKGSVRGKTEAQLRKMLYQVQQFVTSKRTSVSGMRSHMRSTIKQINEMYGDEILNKDNFNEYIEFINDKSLESVFNGVDSSQIVELWALRSQGLSMNSIRKDWEQLLNNQEEVFDYLKSQKGKGKKISYNKLRELIE